MCSFLSGVNWIVVDDLRNFRKNYEHDMLIVFLEQGII
jgi:hypothetical protein